MIKMAQLVSMRRRLLSSGVLLEEEVERERREEERRSRKEAEGKSRVRSWLRKLLPYRGEDLEQLGGREEEGRQSFRWRRKVQLGQKLQEAPRREEGRPSRTFEEGVAEVISVHEAEEVFADDFEDSFIVDDTTVNMSERSINNTSGFNISGFNISSRMHCSFTSIDSSYQNFKSSLKSVFKAPASSSKLEENETYESFDAVDGNIDQVLTKNFARSRLRGPAHSEAARTGPRRGPS